MVEHQPYIEDQATFFNVLLMTFIFINKSGVNMYKQLVQPFLRTFYLEFDQNVSIGKKRRVEQMKSL